MTLNSRSAELLNPLCLAVKTIVNSSALCARPDSSYFSARSCSSIKAGNKISKGEQIHEATTVVEYSLAILLLPVLGMAQAPAGAAAARPYRAAKVAWLSLEQAIFSTDDGKRNSAKFRSSWTRRTPSWKVEKGVGDAEKSAGRPGPKLTDEARADSRSRSTRRTPDYSASSRTPRRKSTPVGSRRQYDRPQDAADRRKTRQGKGTERGFLHQSPA